MMGLEPFFFTPEWAFMILYLEIAVVKMVEDIGVEPMTSCVQGRRSSQLS
jgi:hypothetical protein